MEQTQDDVISNQAVQLYMCTEEFQIKCREALQQRIGKLEKELRDVLKPKIEQKLRQELYPVVEAHLMDEIRKRSEHRLQLISVKEIVTQQNNGTLQQKRPRTDDVNLIRQVLEEEN